MSWVFLDGHKYSLAGASYRMEFDGAELWVTMAGQQVQVFRFWGEQPTAQDTIDLSTYFTGDAVYLVRTDGYMYVFEGTTSGADYDEFFIPSFVKIDTTTKEVIEQVTLPTTAHCIPGWGYFKLWFATVAEQDDDASDDRQKLFTYDTTDGTWSAQVDIPGNKQFSARRFIWGRETWMFVDSFNENAVLKFNHDTEAYVSTITTNRKPNAFYVNGDRELVIGGKNGMVTVVNQTTEAASNDWSTNGEAESLADDLSYIWSVNPTLARTEKDVTYTDNYRVMGAGGLDYEIEPFTDTTFKQLLLSPQYTHNWWDGDSIEEVTEPQYIVVLADTNLYVATNLTNSWDLEEIRLYELEVQATAMVATGPEKYYGETA